MEITCPSLEEIYDLTSEELTSIQQQLTGILAKQELLSQEKREFYTQMTDSIALELQERTTIDFFTEMCKIENPYLDKITDFNNQFLKLAGQAIQKQDHQQLSSQEIPEKHQQQSSHLIPQKQHLQPIHEEQQEQQQEQFSKVAQSETDGVSTTSNNTLVSDRKDTHESAFSNKNMGILNRKKPKEKNKANEMMKEFLERSRKGEYVAIKGNNTNNNSRSNYDANGRLISNNSNSNQLRSKEAIKGSKSPEGLPKSEKNIKTHEKGSHEKMTKTHERVSEKELHKKREEIGEKVKNMKKKVVTNHNNYNLNKHLVDMVRKQEQDKDNKETKNVQKPKKEKQPSSQTTFQNQAYSSLTQQQPHHFSEGTITSTENDHKTQIIQGKESQVKPSMQLKSDQSVSKDVVQQQKQAQKRQQTQKEQWTQKKQQTPKEQTRLEGVQHTRGAQQEQSDEEIKEQILNTSKNSEHEEHKRKKSNDIIEEIIKEEDIEDSTDKPELLPEKPMTVFNSEQPQHARSTKQLMGTFGRIVEEEQAIEVQQSESTIQPTQTHPQQTQEASNLQDPSEEEEEDPQDTKNEEKPEVRKKEENKKCYNEEYWVHVREQAERQIERMKQEKQLIEKEKKRAAQQLKEKPAEDQKQELEQESEAKSNIQPQGNPDNRDSTQEYIEQQKLELSKMKKNHQLKQKKRKQHVNPAPLVKKVIHPKPQFDYLQVYPSFNHIFSVMYLKPTNQALLDIPVIMKDLINLFSLHVQHFKGRNLQFQPAVFLPFDHSNSLQLTDPRQLLLNAENTYVNLKVLVERLETFNGNLHGQFKTTENRFYRVIKSREEVYDIVTTSFLRRKGWKQLPHGCSLRASWNLFWSWSKPEVDMNRLLIWQRINHFPFNKNLTRKDLLYRNLDAFRKQYRLSMNFLPLTYVLPKEFTAFSIRFHEQEISNSMQNYWIMKPIGKSRGRGIKVISSLAQLSYTDNIVVQKYLSNPLLLDGYKFDMRIYVLVTSFHPLQAFIYRQGFARFSTQKYSMDPGSIKNAFIHLTNFSIQKNNVEGKKNFSGGSKISLKSLRERLTKLGFSFNSIWKQIHDIVIKSLLGCSVSVPPFPSAFELFGYDVMIDTESKCHLIEINASPSLERSFLIDEIVKQSLVDDIFDLVDPPDFDKKELLNVMSERLQAMANKKQLTRDDDLVGLARVLNYKKIRKTGELPQKMGLFEMLAPSPSSLEIEKLIKTKSSANNPLNID